MMKNLKKSLVASVTGLTLLVTGCAGNEFRDKRTELRVPIEVNDSYKDSVIITAPPLRMIDVGKRAYTEYVSTYPSTRGAFYDLMVRHFDNARLYRRYINKGTVYYIRETDFSDKHPRRTYSLYDENRDGTLDIVTLDEYREESDILKGASDKWVSTTIWHKHPELSSYIPLFEWAKKIGDKEMPEMGGRLYYNPVRDKK